MSKYLIEVKKLKKNFDHRNGQIKVFQDVNLGIKTGELVALVGPSGSGKSSFLHLLSLLDQPSSGKVLFLDKDSKNFNENQKNEIRRKKISIIFQDNNLLSDFTAIENVLMPLIIRGENYKKSFEKAWNKLSNWSKRCYLTSKAPGNESNKPSSGFPKEFESIAPDFVTNEKGLKNFAVISIKIERIEWLFLASQGHRRAIFKIDRKNSKINISSQWLIP